jgi:hypothetical protein
MSCFDVVIRHDNCAFDANCGLTCDGVFQRELAANPGMVVPPGFYEDFISSCYLFYWPDGCSSFASDSLGFAAVVHSNEVLSYLIIGVVLVLSFIGGFAVGNR